MLGHDGPSWLKMARSGSSWLKLAHVGENWEYVLVGDDGLCEGRRVSERLKERERLYVVA